MNSRGWIILALIVVLVGAVVLYWTRDNGSRTNQSTGTHALFACDGGRSIDATFSEGDPMPPAEEGMPPTPTGSVLLILSDSRELTLPRALSADGARYASADESIVFWNVGSRAMFTEPQEDGTSLTINCTAQ